MVDTALKEAGLTPEEIDAIAFTRGPGLLGSLLVGVSFAKGLSIAHNIPMVEVNHLQGHILSHFIDLQDRALPHPGFPFLCLLVSGGHTQIVRVDSPLEMEIIGTTIDDAAGEAFDKCAKVMGLPYPGGPVIDKLAKEGDPKAFRFARPHVDGYDYSFSGLKTSFLYTLRDAVANDPGFIENNKAVALRFAAEARSSKSCWTSWCGPRRTSASATSPSRAAFRPTQDCATGSSKRAAGAAGARSCPNSSSRRTTRR